eukprot:gnl/Chilomastix_caulleri/1777.p1 GENE.gnl/Chilomastix_caulleri/1777~~gnl/Chilomastix_caulleri/1777.p1  ORF type:complete len:106 (-),score=27.71 gnl/Chilomastix_caulleri/1777:205-522(-)
MIEHSFLYFYICNHSLFEYARRLLNHQTWRDSIGIHVRRFVGSRNPIPSAPSVDKVGVRRVVKVGDIVEVEMEEAQEDTTTPQPPTPPPSTDTKTETEPQQPNSQ